MAFRFQRRIRIAPGIRLNISKSGIGLSAGPRGASLSVGRRGVYGNAGIPGTGLSYRAKLKNTNNSGRSTGERGDGSAIKFVVNSEGIAELRYADGSALSSSETAAVRKNHGSQLRAILEDECEKRNDALKALTTFHHRLPKPTRSPTYETSRYRFSEPSPGLAARMLAAIFPPYKRKLAEESESWLSAKNAHDSHESERKRREEHEVFQSTEAMEKVLAEYLGEIEWPQEPAIDFDFGESNKTLAIDVLLPSEDGIPDEEWSVPSTQYRLTSKTISVSKRREIYRDYVHSILMRVVGEIYARLPTVEHVMVSAYREIVNPANGNDKDEYIISVIVHRDRWESMSFSRLKQIDPVEVFAEHLLARKMTKTGIFKAITPFSLEQLDEQILKAV